MHTCQGKQNKWVISYILQRLLFIPYAPGVLYVKLDWLWNTSKKAWRPGSGRIATILRFSNCSIFSQKKKKRSLRRTIVKMEWWLHAYEHWLLLQKTHVGSQHPQGTAPSVVRVLKAPTPTNGLHRLHMSVVHLQKSEQNGYTHKAFFKAPLNLQWWSLKIFFIFKIANLIHIIFPNQISQFTADWSGSVRMWRRVPDIHRAIATDKQSFS